jgi:hypothetical protein
MEISVRTLRWVLAKAQRWNSFSDGRRNITVTNYVVEDHLDPSKNETCIHIVLYDQAINGIHHSLTWKG